MKDTALEYLYYLSQVKFFFFILFIYLFFKKKGSTCSCTFKQQCSIFRLFQKSISIILQKGIICFSQHRCRIFFFFFIEFFFFIQDPLQFHLTQSPLLEEYTCAAKRWKLTAVKKKILFFIFF
jgi:hypothetical protein